MRKIFSLDRIEGEIAVCISDDEEQFDLSLSSLGGLKTHDVFSAEIVGDSLTDIVPMPEERERRLRANKDRLHRLAKRNKS